MFARCVRRRTWPSLHVSNAGGCPAGRSAGWLRHRPPPPVTLIGTRDVFFFVLFFHTRSGVLRAATAGTKRRSVMYFFFPISFLFLPYSLFARVRRACVYLRYRLCCIHFRSLRCTPKTFYICRARATVANNIRCETRSVV
jgi:hypothetical protein